MREALIDDQRSEGAGNRLRMIGEDQIWPTYREGNLLEEQGNLPNL